MTLDNLFQSYVAGTLDRVQLVDELVRWDYAPRAVPADFDDVLIESPGSFADVERALRRGVIDDALFDEVADRIEAGASA